MKEMIGHLWLLIISWSNQNEGFITLLGCVLGIPSLIYTGWNLREYISQKRKDEIKERREKIERAQTIEQAQWRGIYRILKQVGYYATLIPQCQETLSLAEFFGITYRSTEQRASPEFANGLQKINTIVLTKAGGKPLALPEAWKDKFNSGIVK